MYIHFWVIQTYLPNKKKKDFKNYLKHKRKEMNLEDLIVRLRIEEDNRVFEKRGNQAFQFKQKANIVE